MQGPFLRVSDCVTDTDSEKTVCGNFGDFCSCLTVTSHSVPVDGFSERATDKNN